MDEFYSEDDHQHEHPQPPIHTPKNYPCHLCRLIHYGPGGGEAHECPCHHGEITCVIPSATVEIIQCSPDFLKLKPHHQYLSITLEFKPGWIDESLRPGFVHQSIVSLS